MKIRLALLALLMALATFSIGVLLLRKPTIQKPNPGTPATMDLVFYIPKGEHNTGWCSNDAQSWWPARADSRCYEEDKKFGTCASPSVSEPWCNDGDSGEILNQDRRTN